MRNFNRQRVAGAFSITVIALLTWTLTGFSAQQTVKPTGGVDAVIEFETNVHDFGRVPAGKTVLYDFKFTNTGTEPLQIQDVKTSCGCTTAGKWKSIIGPGETGLIPIELSTGRFSGSLKKTITVVSNSASSPRTILTMKGNIWQAIEILPSQASFRVTSTSVPPLPRRIRIKSNLDELLTLSDLTLEGKGGFKAELKTVVPGKEFELIVSMVPPLKTGYSRGVFTLKTSSTVKPVISIPASAVVQKPVSVYPARILMPPGKLIREKKQYISIRNNTSDELHIKNMTVDLAGVTTELKAIRPGKQFRITLVFPKGFQLPSDHHGVVHFETSHPEFAEIDIPINLMPKRTRSLKGIKLPERKTVK